MQILGHGAREAAIVLDSDVPMEDVLGSAGNEL